MTIYRKETYVVDGYTFDHISTARLYETLKDRLKHNFDYYVSGQNDELIIINEQNNIEFDVIENYNQLLTLSYYKVDTNPTITMSRIVEYHDKGFDFAYYDGVKYLYLETDLENLEENLKRFANEIKYF